METRTYINYKSESAIKASHDKLFTRFIMFPLGVMALGGSFPMILSHYECMFVSLCTTGAVPIGTAFTIYQLYSSTQDINKILIDEEKARLNELTKE